MDITIALQRAVKAFPLGSAALAARLGISSTSLMHKTSPTYPGAHCSPEEAMSIMEITGDHGALHAMAAQLGHMLVPMPAAGGESPAMAALADTVSEFGEFIGATSRALADGTITDNERRRIEREGAEALAAIHRLMALAAGINESGKPAALRQVRGQQFIARGTAAS